MVSPQKGDWEIGTPRELQDTVKEISDGNILYLSVIILPVIQKDSGIKNIVEESDPVKFLINQQNINE